MAYEVKRDYVENENHVPNPTDRYGTVLTGGEQVSVEKSMPLWDRAKREALKLAGRALDPDDDTPESHVVIPQGTVVSTIDEEAHKQAIRDRAAKVVEEDEASDRPLDAQVAGERSEAGGNPERDSGSVEPTSAASKDASANVADQAQVTGTYATTDQSAVPATGANSTSPADNTSPLAATEFQPVPEAQTAPESEETHPA